ncbi:YceH family protein [Vibrio sp. WJH972]
MPQALTKIESRVIGCLLEKEVTTPDYYPLTLNSLTSACNQKSNRDPVMDLSDAEVLDALQGLISRRLVSDESSFNSRTSKYQHRFCNTEFGDLQLSEQELGVVSCLLLRGPQTPGELRTRTNRMCQFADVKETESVLEELLTKEYVVKLEREPGKRESRFMQCFSDDDISHYQSENVSGALLDTKDSDRVFALEQDVAELKIQVARLTEQLDQLI